jgi:twitching motility protein PilI
MLGLRNADDLVPAASDPNATHWSGEAFTDNDGRRWKMLNVRQLLADEDFMDIGV